MAKTAKFASVCVEDGEDVAADVVDGAGAVDFGVFAGVLVEADERLGLLVVGGDAVGDDVVAGIVFSSLDFGAVADAVENHLVRYHD